MMFVDEIQVTATAGKGGDGAVTFRHEAKVPRGGPSGGDGGHGGSVILVGDDGCNTLSHLRYRRILKAKNGVPGAKDNCHGRKGEDCKVKVPVGTLIYDAETDEVLGDIVACGQELIVAKGGRGGRGNARFATPENRTPNTAETGRRGQEKKLRLELKLLADVGLLGFPSVGKSSLIKQVSKACPTVADYPFTTLVPHLGVVELSNYESFVVADVPGLIVGASEGRGLGIDFLKHLVRTRILVHIIEVTEQLEGCETERDPIGDFEKLNHELSAFSEELSQKPQIVVLNKIELEHVRKEIPRLRAYFEEKGYRFFAISCHTREGLQELVNALGELVLGHR